ncbi:MAG TPA: hypothetical protein VJN18_34085 [Polyangiaceae bacterium]|nr:hypothetical protein [Polyangiaceae bacterium]
MLNVTRKPRVFFICGSLNQTTQMHQIADQLADCESWFSPYYGDAYLTRLRRLGLVERTIAGRRLRQRCLDYLSHHDLAIDLDGQQGGYDLVVTCSDVIIPKNVRRMPMLVVQEGILDPDNYLWPLIRRFPGYLPRWLVGTAATGLSGQYDTFCVASEGYREHFVANGAPAERVVVTGMPNFDDCARFRDNDFPLRGYALVCTSDARETFKLDDRRGFIQQALALAGDHEVIFKLHPNEDLARATAEIKTWAPGTRIFSSGPTEAMIANCELLITQFSSVVFVGLALGKQVHSYHPLETLQRLMPVQNRCAARNIARECRRLLARRPALLEHFQREVA